jgi:molybdenum cofactor synthesis domain-containing protein
VITLEEAKERVWGRLRAAQPVKMSIRIALGCVLAEDVVATEAIPPFDNTSVDGYAVRSSDVQDCPVELAVVGEIRAGSWPDGPVGPGEAIRIMTGAPMPAGADAVVMVEDTDGGAGRTSVRILKPVAPGEAIRPSGDDVSPGDLVLPAGTVLGPAYLGVLAELGRLEVLAYPRLRVAVISTGDELVDDGRPLAPGQIRESNGELVCSLLSMANCEPVNFGIVADEEEALGTALARAAQECDAVITSGGVSMGDYDLVKVLLDRLGEMDWMQIAIRPAKPFAFGLIGPDRATPVFGLPGNPVSSMVSFELLARPALLKMMGHAAIERPALRAIADKGVRRNRSDDRVNFVRVVATTERDGRVHVATSGAQGSHQLAASAAANGLVRVDVSSEVEPGGEVDVILIGVPPGQL